MPENLMSQNQKATNDKKSVVYDARFVRLCSKSPSGETTRGDIVLIRGAINWVEQQRKEHPFRQSWYEKVKDG